MLFRVPISPWLTPPRLVPVDEAQANNVVRMPRFLSDDDIDSLRAAAVAVSVDLERAGRPGAHDLAFRQASPKGSWSSVFLNHRMAELLPALHSRLFAAAKAADQAQWGLLDADRHALSFRVAELHTVTPGGGIRSAVHHDYGSLITLDLMLSDPEDFEGGSLQTPEADGSLVTHRFERGDLLLFQSHKYHSVTPVTAGTRSVLVLELWEGLPRRCPRRCTDPWGPCACQFASKPRVYQSDLYRRTVSEHFVPAAMLRLLKQSNSLCADMLPCWHHGV